MLTCHPFDERSNPVGTGTNVIALDIDLLQIIPGQGTGILKTAAFYTQRRLNRARGLVYNGSAAMR